MAAVTLDRLALAADAPPRSRILVDGAETGAVADGAWLEATFDVGPGRLLFTTDDVPFEEALHVQLFAHDWAALDAATVAWPGISGRLDGPERLDAARFRFEFLGGGPIELVVLDAPELRLPLVGGVLGIARRRQRRAWLRFRNASKR